MSVVTGSSPYIPAKSDPSPGCWSRFSKCFSSFNVVSRIGRSIRRFFDSLLHRQPVNDRSSRKIVAVVSSQSANSIDLILKSYSTIVAALPIDEVAGSKIFSDLEGMEDLEIRKGLLEKLIKEKGNEYIFSVGCSKDAGYKHSIRVIKRKPEEGIIDTSSDVVNEKGIVQELIGIYRCKSWYHLSENLLEHISTAAQDQGQVSWAVNYLTGEFRDRLVRDLERQLGNDYSIIQERSDRTQNEPYIQIIKREAASP